MSAASDIESQVAQIRQGGRSVLFRKIKRVLRILLKLPLFILAVLVVVVTRLIRPLLLVRWGVLPSPRIGHFAANTELYLCERDAGINVPSQRHVDIFVMEPPISNLQLSNMWKRALRVWPAWWILPSIQRVNRLMPGGALHEIGDNTRNDRDVHNLLDRFPPHLGFTPEEAARGEAGLRMMGIPADTPFVCLIVRDSAYLDAHQNKDWSYHNYRDSDIHNYRLAAEALAERGYYVIRMGAKVRDAIRVNHPRVIDYATNGMRSDFMDVYLGARCAFCLSTSTGFDCLPLIFRRPIVYVNMVPVGYLYTFTAQSIGITKHHFAMQQDRELTLKEIFAWNVGFSLRTSDYESRGIKLIENTPEEIRDIVVEMAERLNDEWQARPNDDTLQQRFGEIFQAHACDAHKHNPIHGEIRLRFGAQFLRSSAEFLQ